MVRHRTQKKKIKKKGAMNNKVLERLFRTGQTVRFMTLDAYVHGRDPTV